MSNNNFTVLNLNTGSVHLENNLYQDDIFIATNATGTYLAGTLLVRSGTNLSQSALVTDAHVSVLAHDVEHVNGTASPVRVLYAGKIREDHVFLGATTTPVALTNPVRDQLRSAGINPTSLTELNG